MSFMDYYRATTFVVALISIQATETVSKELQIDEIFSMNGECTADINGTDIGCDKKVVYTKLINGRQLVNFTGLSITTIGFSGKLDNAANDIIWIDRIYLEQNQYDADGSCEIKLGATGPETIKCRAILRDGRKISGNMPLATVQKFNIPRATSSSQQVSQCSILIKQHGYLSRAQLQCRYRYYSNEMLERARNCGQMLTDEGRQQAIMDGLLLFDKHEKESGRRLLCKRVLQDFPTIVKK